MLRAIIDYLIPPVWSASDEAQLLAIVKAKQDGRLREMAVLEARHGTAPTLPSIEGEAYITGRVIDYASRVTGVQRG